MLIGRKLMGASIATFLIVAGLSAFGIAPDAQRHDPQLVTEAPASITIRVQASVVAGDTLCFEVVSFTPLASVTMEINDIILPLTQSTSTDPGVSIFCGRTPLGSAGSVVTITAVTVTGQVATTTVTVT